MILKSGTMMHFAQALIEIGNLNSSGKKREALDRTVEIRKEVFNARTRLDEIGFEDQIKILDNYIETLGKELALNEEEIAELKSGMILKSLRQQ